VGDCCNKYDKEDNPPPCDCPTIGWCERHLRYKNERQYYLCRKRDDYRALWDEMAKEPDLQEKAKPLRKYYESTRKWVEAGCPIRSKPDQVHILREICEMCEEYTKGKLGVHCAKCGCALNAKIERATESCPIGKW